MKGEEDKQKQFYTSVNKLMEGFQLIGPDWRYLYVNDAVVKQSKYSREELLGHTMMEKYPGIENTELFAVLKSCLKDQKIRHFENEFVFPDGSKGWFDLSIQPVPAGLFILSVDITERKKAELENKDHIKKLEELMYITSHKVRGPVAHIVGASHLLEHAEQSAEELQKICGIMKEAASTLDTCTRELSDFVHQLKQKAANNDKTMHN